MAEGTPHWFITTHWSLVQAAGVPGDPEARAALESLCTTYWQPLYAYARRSGCDMEEAQDLTQAFFARLLEKEYLQAADRRRGRFRSFLLTAFKHFMANEWARERAMKRGGGARMISIDAREAEEWFAREPVDSCTPLEIFERRWVLSLLEKAFARLRAEYTAPGRERVYDAMKDYLLGESGEDRYKGLAAALDMSETAVKVAVHRLKKRFRELLLEEAAQTTSAPGEAEEEIRYMMQVLGR